MKSPPATHTARLVVTCPDRPGIVAAVSGFFAERGINITAMDQHSTDPEGGTFFLRLEFQTPEPDDARRRLERDFAGATAELAGLTWRMSYADRPKRMAILVSRQDHALLELLWRWSRGELPALVTEVVSNHDDLRGAVEAFGVPFHHVPVSPETKASAEERLLAIVEESADLVVLARYMQVLSARVVERFVGRMINIHHSFLPAFAGASPYRQAYERGVKRIGATAHYVTETLDDGPIIEQDVLRVSHRDSHADLVALGRDVERQVLARAVKWHLEDRVVVHDGKTIVFA